MRMSLAKTAKTLVPVQLPPKSRSEGTDKYGSFYMLADLVLKEGKNMYQFKSEVFLRCFFFHQLTIEYCTELSNSLKT